MTGSSRVKRGMAEILKGAVVMDVVNVEQACIAEDAGAVAVMALERVPADIYAQVAQGGVSRMSDPDVINEAQTCGLSWPLTRACSITVKPFKNDNGLDPVHRLSDSPRSRRRTAVVAASP